MHYSCILVTQPSKNEPVGPIEVVKTEPGVEFLVEPEENQGKQLSMILCTYLILFSVVISFESITRVGLGPMIFENLN